MRRGIARITRPDGPAACPGCSRPLCMGTPADGQLLATCMHCNERVTFVNRDGVWRVHSRSKAPPT
jgi:hypothetical protein